MIFRIGESKKVCEDTGKGVEKQSFKRQEMQELQCLYRKNTNFCKGISLLYIFVPSKKSIGELAHLARALAWQARGDRFESGILH